MKKSRKIRVRKHRRKTKKGGTTVVRQHNRQIKTMKRKERRLRKRHLKATLSAQFKGYVTGEIPGWSEEPLHLIDTRSYISPEHLQNFYQVINDTKNVVTYRGRNIVKIPKENDYLLEAKIKLWSELNKDWPSITLWNKALSTWDILGLSDLDYEELVDNAIEYQKEIIEMERQRVGKVYQGDIDNLQEIIWFVSRLLNTHRISKEVANKAMFILEKERTEAIQSWAKGWIEWGKKRSN